MSPRFVIPSILMLVCTLTLVQGRSSNTRAKQAEAFRDLHLEIAKQAKEQTDKVVANFTKWIENYKKNSDKYNNLHPQIQAIVHEQVKQAVEKHVKDSLNEVINPAKLISSAQRNSQLTRDSRDNHHQNNGRNNNRNKNKQCDESEDTNSGSQNKNEVNAKSFDTDDLARFVSEFTNTLSKLENLKFKLGNAWEGKENLTKTQLISKLDELREDLNRPAPYSSDNKDSSFKEDDESDDIDENDDDVNVIIESEINEVKHNIEIHREIRNHIFETLESEIKALRSAKLDALNAKSELIQAASKLHESFGKPGATFDFQSLAQFKAKIFEVSVRKKQYVNQRLLFKKKVKEAITDFKSNPGGTTDTVQQQGTEESEETVTIVSIGPAEAAGDTREHVEQTAARIEQETEPVGHTTEHVGLTTKHVKYTTGHDGATTEHIGQTTGHAGHTTEHIGHTTGHAGGTTEHIGHTTGHAGGTTEHIGHTTGHAGRTTEHIGHTTGKAGHTTEHIGHTTGHAEHTTQESGISTNDSSAPVEGQIPEEFADTEDGEGVNSSSDQIVSAGARNSSRIEADASTQNGGESSSSPHVSSAARAYNSSSNNANASDASGLKLAANYGGGGGEDDGDESGTVAVVVVLACLVICSVVSILGVLLWKRHRRHRLYTKIPSGDLSRQFI
ncbi:hypothetical protein BsWGS_03340 [Bradybaena similaris]